MPTHFRKYEKLKEGKGCSSEQWFRRFNDIDRYISILGNSFSSIKTKRNNCLYDVSKSNVILRYIIYYIQIAAKNINNEIKTQLIIITHVIVYIVITHK